MSENDENKNELSNEELENVAGGRLQRELSAEEVGRGSYDGAGNFTTTLDDGQQIRLGSTHKYNPNRQQNN